MLERGEITREQVVVGRFRMFFEKIGIKHFTVYAFSTENWKRPQEEIDAIFSLLEKYLHEAIDDLHHDNIVLSFWGDLSPLSPKLRALIDESAELSAKNNGMHVNICLNYGGRAEITRAVREIAEKCADGTMKPSDISDADIENFSQISSNIFLSGFV